MSNIRKLLFWVANILLPLITGLIIYILYKPDAYAVDFLHSIFDTRQSLVLTFEKNCLTDFIRFHFCDMCWSYSFTCAVVMLLNTKLKNVILACIINAVLTVVIELLQLQGITSGTFDIIDILLQILSGFISAGIILLHFGGHKK